MRIAEKRLRRIIKSTINEMSHQASSMSDARQRLFPHDSPTGEIFSYNRKALKEMVKDSFQDEINDRKIDKDSLMMIIEDEIYKASADFHFNIIEAVRSKI